MATTTPNYGWTVPTSTDLVKDGATAIETLGDAVDATVFANANAAINKTIVDAKGDLIAATASDTVARLAVGANDTVLMADSTTATGLKWGTIAAGGITQLATGSLSGSSVSITSISGSYKNLYLLVTGASASTATYPRLTLNSDSGMQQNGFNGQGNATSTYSYILPIGSGARTMNAANAHATFWVTVYDYTRTGTMRTYTTQAGYKDTDIGDSATIFGGVWQNTANAVTSIQIEVNAGSWDAGTYTLYGVS